MAIINLNLNVNFFSHCMTTRETLQSCIRLLFKMSHRFKMCIPEPPTGQIKPVLKC